MTAALLINPSIRPNAVSDSPTTRSTSTRELASAGTGTEIPPRASISVAIWSRRLLERATSTTLAPCSAQRSASARPSPGPTPDTITTRSASSMDPPEATVTSR